MLIKTGILVTIVCAGMFAPKAAEAAIFKCVGSDGEVSYNQVPCPAEEETAKVMRTSSSNKTSFDCRIANNFARKTAMGMRSGQSSGDVFAYYGGLDALPRTAIGVINYVFSHIENVDTGPQRIAALSAARCSAGSYGPVGCEDFPYSFVAELGGCEAATKSTIAAPKAAAASAPAETNAATQNAGSQAMGVRTTDNKSISSVDCKDSVQAKLNALFSQMRSGGQATNSQGELKEQQDNLKAQLSGC